MGERMRTLKEYRAPFRVEAGRNIVDVNGRFLCRIDRGDDAQGYDRLTPCACDELAQFIAACLTADAAMLRENDE